MAAKQPKKNGRPKIELTPEQCELAETLAGMQCTHAEIAAVLKVSEDTITRRKQDDPSFAEAIKRGQENGKASIRRMQYKAAKDGNATMQIWLGKQYLGQSDKREDTLHQHLTTDNQAPPRPKTFEEWLERKDMIDSVGTAGRPPVSSH